MQLEWKNKTMYVSTNSSVLGVVFDSTNMALSVSVGGPDGTTGIANITIPIEMISSLSAVQVTLDNQPIDFQINQVGNNAQIYVQYHHSLHDLTAHLRRRWRQHRRRRLDRHIGLLVANTVSSHCCSGSHNSLQS
jgi:hypothetical protein